MQLERSLLVPLEIGVHHFSELTRNKIAGHAYHTLRSNCHERQSERVISAEDVLNGEINKKRATELPASEALGVIDKLVENCKDNDWKAKQAKNAAKFALARGGEQLIYFWNALSKTQNLANIRALHKESGQKVGEVVRAARGLAS